MKKASVLFLVAFAFAPYVQPASAGYVLTGDKVSLKTLIANPSGGGPYLMDVQDPSRTDFETFCLERNEYFVPGNTVYDVTVGSAAMKGGIAGGSPDPLDGRTAYLYKAYRLNELAGSISYEKNSSVYSFNWTDSDSDKIAVQDAIWYLENELTSTGASSSKASILVGWLDSLSAVDLAAALDHVRVANLWAEGHAGELAHAKQSQLTLVPEPASVAVWSFIVSVFGGAFYLRRKRSI